MVLLSLLGIPEEYCLTCFQLYFHVESFRHDKKCTVRPDCHIGKTHYSLIKGILRIAPANIHLSELQVREAVISRELAEDMGEVDAGR